MGESKRKLQCQITVFQRQKIRGYLRRELELEIRIIYTIRIKIEKYTLNTSGGIFFVEGTCPWLGGGGGGGGILGHFSKPLPPCGLLFQTYDPNATTQRILTL